MWLSMRLLLTPLCSVQTMSISCCVCLCGVWGSGVGIGVQSRMCIGTVTAPVPQLARMRRQWLLSFFPLIIHKGGFRATISAFLYYLELSFALCNPAHFITLYIKQKEQEPRAGEALSFCSSKEADPMHVCGPKYFQLKRKSSIL